MFEDVHDSLLVEYVVVSESEQLVLKLHPRNGSAAPPFKVIFHGTVAHCFETPLLPAILFGIETTFAETLIAENWQCIELGQKANGWPGPWAASLADATQFVRSSNLIGFNIKSRYGLSGWVLAKSVERTAAG